MLSAPDGLLSLAATQAGGCRQRHIAESEPPACLADELPRTRPSPRYQTVSVWFPEVNFYSFNYKWFPLLSIENKDFEYYFEVTYSFKGFFVLGGTFSWEYTQGGAIKLKSDICLGMLVNLWELL